MFLNYLILSYFSLSLLILFIFTNNQIGYISWWESLSESERFEVIFLWPVHVPKLLNDYLETSRINKMIQQISKKQSAEIIEKAIQASNEGWSEQQWEDWLDEFKFKNHCEYHLQDNISKKNNYNIWNKMF